MQPATSTHFKPLYLSELAPYNLAGALSARPCPSVEVPHPSSTTFSSRFVYVSNRSFTASYPTYHSLLTSPLAVVPPMVHPSP
jgi:hypothetical protein